MPLLSAFRSEHLRKYCVAHKKKHRFDESWHWNLSKGYFAGRTWICYRVYHIRYINILCSVAFMNTYWIHMIYLCTFVTQVAKFMEPIWGPPGSCRPQMGPILAPWTLLSEQGCFIGSKSDCLGGSEVTLKDLGEPDHWQTLIAKFMGPTCGPSGADRMAPWTFLSWNPKKTQQNVNRVRNSWVILEIISRIKSGKSFYSCLST